jgi:hypothetical protein
MRCLPFLVELVVGVVVVDDDDAVVVGPVVGVGRPDRARVIK